MAKPGQRVFILMYDEDGSGNKGIPVLVYKKKPSFKRLIRDFLATDSPTVDDIAVVKDELKHKALFFYPARMEGRTQKHF